jgi:hypothetical protein
MLMVIVVVVAIIIGTLVDTTSTRAGGIGIAGSRGTIPAPRIGIRSIGIRSIVLPTGTMAVDPAITIAVRLTVRSMTVMVEEVALAMPIGPIGKCLACFLYFSAFKYISLNNRHRPSRRHSRRHLAVMACPFWTLLSS